MQAGPPQRLVGVDVADAGDERLVHGSGFRPPRRPRMRLRNSRSVKRGSSGSTPCRRRVVVGAVEADPPERAC